MSMYILSLSVVVDTLIQCHIAHCVFHCVSFSFTLPHMLVYEQGESSIQQLEHSRNSSHTFPVLLCFHILLISLRKHSALRVDNARSCPAFL